MEPDDRRQQELIEQLLAERTPTLPDGLTEDDVDLAQTVALLKGARPAALEPPPAFVAALRQRLFEAEARSEGEAPRSHDVSALSRRRLLSALAAGAAAGLAAGAAAGHAAAEGETAARIRQVERHAESSLASMSREETRPYHVPLVGTQGHWVTVAARDQLAPGAVLRFEAGALIGYLLCDSAGGYSAVSAACTHMGCLLTWQPSGRRLLCPCHGSAYDASGAVISGIARHPLPRIQVRLAGNQVQVWTVASGAAGSGVPPYQMP